MERIAITRTDGSVAIMSFVVEGRSPTLPPGAVWFSDGTWAREPSDENIQYEVSKAVPDAVSWRRIKLDDVPVDRTFRDALVDNGGKIEHDISKAKEVLKRNLRHERASKFAELDVAWMRAIASGNTVLAEHYETQRQALRDVTADPRIAAAASVEELKAVVLPG